MVSAESRSASVRLYVRSSYSKAGETLLSSINFRTTVYRSRPVLNSYDPVWDVAEIDLASLCNGNIVSGSFYVLFGLLSLRLILICFGA